ncbi:C39 family peptidase [Mycobacterium sp.]|uniref:C39 family peptidase n=1 Tax=Mycobacterium sp. TaxID=1785 RepID=UPI003BA86AFE
MKRPHRATLPRPNATESANNGMMRTDILDANRTAGIATLLVAAFIGLAGVANADPAGQMYGDPEAAAPYWRYQRQEDCGLMAVADVVGQLTGREPTQVGIQLRSAFTRSEVHRGAIYRFDGTSPEDLVVLLQKYGVTSNLTTGNTMEALEQDLADGHKVIAAVNAETIWNSPPGEGQRTSADHAVVVTGVDTRTDIVHLNDSGIPSGRDEQIPMATFTEAWDTGDDLLIVTSAAH